MLSTLPSVIQQFVNQTSKKRKHQQLQIDTLVLLQALREGKQITLKQLLYVLSQILQQHNQNITNYFDNLQKLIHSTNEPIQLRLNMSPVNKSRSLLLQQKNKQFIQNSDIYQQFQELNQINQNSQLSKSQNLMLQKELQLLDNVVINAIQTQSQFLGDLTQQEVRNGDDQSKVENQEIVRSGEELQLNISYDQADDVQISDNNQLLLSNDKNENPTNYDDVFRDETVMTFLQSDIIKRKALKPQKPKQQYKDQKEQLSTKKGDVKFIIIKDEIKKQTNQILETPKLLRMGQIQNKIDLKIKQLVDINDVYDEINKNNQEQDNQLDLQISYHQDNDEEIQVSGNAFQISNAPSVILNNNYQELKEYVSLIKLAVSQDQKRKEYLCDQFIKCLELHKENHVDLLQKDNEVFVKGKQ